MIEPASSSNVLGTLGINGKLFLAQLVNVSIVMLVMWRWVYRPLVALMDKRAKEITDGIENAAKAKSALSDAEIEKDRVMQQARVEARTILDDTRSKAEAVRTEKMALAKQEIEKAVDEAKARIQGERQAALDSLKQEVAVLLTSAMEKAVAGLDEGAKKTLVAQAVREIEKS